MPMRNILNMSPARVKLMDAGKTDDKIEKEITCGSIKSFRMFDLWMRCVNDHIHQVDMGFRFNMNMGISYLLYTLITDKIDI